VYRKLAISKFTHTGGFCFFNWKGSSLLSNAMTPDTNGFPPIFISQEHLTPGDDGHYLEHRNYLLNDIQPLGEGGFGTCVPGQDLRTQKVGSIVLVARISQPQHISVTGSINSQLYTQRGAPWDFPTNLPPNNVFNSLFSSLFRLVHV
jgi:hypothetical protein